MGIATAGAHQTQRGPGQSTFNAFLVKFNGAGVRQWATYYGGSTIDRGNSCYADSQGNVYLAGETSETLTSTIIATANSHQPTNGGSYDAFLAKFDSNGNRLWGTYYGGNNSDGAYATCVDLSGNVYLAGTAGQINGTVIATPGSHQDTCGSYADAFLVKFNSAGVRQWATYYGGNGYDQGRGCSADASRNIALAGYTQSTNTISIATSGAQQTSFGGSTDMFITFFDSSGVRKWGTYYGGSDSDNGLAVRTDPYGNLYLAGAVSSTTGLSTSGSHQSQFGGNQDALLAKFCALTSKPVNTTNSANQTVCYNTSASISASGNGNLTWFSAPTGGSYLGSGNTYSTPTLTTNTTVYVQDSTFCGTSPRTAITVTVNPLPNVSCSSSSTLICNGQSATLTVVGANTYTWNSGSNAQTIVISPTVTSTYSVSGTSIAGCIKTATFTQNVSTCTSLPEQLNSEILIYPNPVKTNLQVINMPVGISKLKIYDVVGNCVLETDGEHLPNSADGEVKVDCSQFKPGIYFLEIKNAAAVKLFKIVKL